MGINDYTFKEGVNLREADLQRADLREVNLREASLMEIKLLVIAVKLLILLGYAILSHSEFPALHKRMFKLRDEFKSLMEAE